MARAAGSGGYAPGIAVHVVVVGVVHDDRMSCIEHVKRLECFIIGNGGAGAFFFFMYEISLQLKQGKNYL